MNPNKIQPGILKYPSDLYLSIDLGEGEDYEYGYHRQEFVVIRKIRKCHTGELDHPVGTLMIKESALVDGVPSTCYLCIPCADRYLAFDDSVEDENEDIVNPHSYHCDGQKREPVQA